MTPTRQLIKAAVDGLSADFDKIAVVPVEGGQIPPPAGALAPPMPPGMSPGMMPPGGDPSMGGMPPMDPSMMGGAPPMDPSMMGGMPPMDPAAMGGAPPAGPPPGDAGAPPPPPADGGSPSDPAVPLSAIANFTTAIIEATKGKRTADPKDPNAPGDPAAQDPAAASGLPPSVASLGGAPSDAPMPLPGMPPAGGKAARALDEILHGIKTSRGYTR